MASSHLPFLGWDFLDFPLRFEACVTDVTAKKLNCGRKCARITRAREDAALYFCLLFAFAISLHHPLLHSSFLVA